MITPEKIDEWIKEVEERPASGTVILRYIANRLRDLTERNEELNSENILLRTGQKVEDLENRITSLEYQLELLKRSVGPGGGAAGPAVETVSVIVFNPAGRVLRVEIPIQSLESGITAARFAANADLAKTFPRMLVTAPTEELLFVFDSGRSLRAPVAAVPALGVENLDWAQAMYQEPRGGEELSAVMPVARLPLFDFCVQISRKGCVKKTMRAYMETHISKGYVGAGVKAKVDRTFSLLLCGKQDHIVLASSEGQLIDVDIDLIPFNVEEALKLNTSDYITDSFVRTAKQALILVTQTGKVVQRETAWLEPVNTLKTRGQTALSGARRDAGVRLVGASGVDEKDWAVSLHAGGQLKLHRTADLLNRGSLLAEGETGNILALATFSPPETEETTVHKE